eukprot:110539_1
MVSYLRLALLQYILLSVLTNSNYVNWTQSPISLPRNGKEMAVSYDSTDDTIWLLGGLYTKQLISFHNNTFTDFGSSNLSNYVYGNGQFYSQLQNILWMIDPYYNQTFCAFDVETHIFTPSYASVIIPVDVGIHACLTSIDNGVNSYLFVVGGWNQNLGVLDKLQIYNISSGEWLTKSIPEPKQDSSCIVHIKHERLYIIGGKRNGIYFRAIEALFIGNDLQNIDNEQWEFIGNLTTEYGLSHTRGRPTKYVTLILT